MTMETCTSSADLGFPPRVTEYLSTLQTDALHLEKLLEAANSLAADDRRSTITLEIIVGALEIAKNLQLALDTVTIDENLALIEGQE